METGTMERKKGRACGSCGSYKRPNTIPWGPKRRERAAVRAFSEIMAESFTNTVKNTNPPISRH
jgi:hypothetical protein